ncbi:hypothetical protein CY34DRAFT_805870 [Suillus luteus UH-Slu-Lm8-n1]|uniref:Unplaced genomic scaffold CY34scaffold_133, whole genome shotgun sequence n=1 Tax=Suillus luteus UH-Slu-Lm8-n1 TaxID=930992 RepID=A0A0D0AIA8_9AGAM|nr:hypothetical protein CY34DRAFT_805870 [Suillus luteus UH-Slu-Lm8-n1]
MSPRTLPSISDSVYPRGRMDIRWIKSIAYHPGSWSSGLVMWRTSRGVSTWLAENLGWRLSSGSMNQGSATRLNG